MYICLILASRGEGGLEKHVRDLSQSLLQLGHRVHVIGDVGFVNTLAKGVEHTAVDMRKSRYNPKLLMQLYRILQQHPFDVIHAQADKAASLLSRFRKLIKKPMVATIHNSQKRTKVYRRFQHVICVSQQLKDELGIKGTHVIYNGIESHIDHQKINLSLRYDLPNDKPVICAIGRLVHAKGFDVLLDAVDGLDVCLLIAGEGSAREALERKIKHMQLNTVVRLIGHHPNPIALMSNVDGVVIASRREGFSYVFNEAIMSGANIVTTDVPVANEILPETLIVPIDDEVILGQRLKKLLADPNYWTKLMQKPRQYAQQQLTVEQMAEKTVQVYQQMLR